ncbi:hypothetical protein ROZALSC1DRAFT_21912 [Rozella allomycis CSF55]|uniref:Uncharacterized protein n=1 Tax=Rozella allomycis (strain CSF55) TaxID=988480 RepID=A0A4P9YK86_ROZAC|nr:hypothetical protein ROZALSC1DRAFT_21912 [Rozella allomycis CSF55]
MSDIKSKVKEMSLISINQENVLENIKKGPDEQSEKISFSTPSPKLSHSSADSNKPVSASLAADTSKSKNTQSTQNTSETTLPDSTQTAPVQFAGPKKNSLKSSGRVSEIRTVNLTSPPNQTFKLSSPRTMLKEAELLLSVASSHQSTPSSSKSTKSPSTILREALLKKQTSPKGPQIESVNQPPLSIPGKKRKLTDAVAPEQKNIKFETDSTIKLLKRKAEDYLLKNESLIYLTRDEFRNAFSTLYSLGSKV